MTITWPISYPVTEDARTAIRQFPAIAKAFQLPSDDRSRHEIVRLLSNVSFEPNHRFLKFVDKWLVVAGPIGKKIIKAKHPFELRQAVAELETFVHLYDRFGLAVQAAESGRNAVSPDVEVRFDTWTVRVEVYTPVDFMGLQLIEQYVPMVLKYLEVPWDYCLRVTTQPLQQGSPGCDQKAVWYPYSIPNEECGTRYWLQEFAKRASQWLSERSPTEELRMPGPGGRVEIVVGIIKTERDPDERLICSHWATRSTDTRLFFEVGTPQDTAKSQWGRKLQSKLKDRQCGQLAEGVLRMLLVNFAMADTGWPNFISEDKFGVRFRDVIRYLDDGKQYYDAVLPAQLGCECCFGQPVWLDVHWEEKAEGFIADAGFDTLCGGKPKPPKFSRGFTVMYNVGKK